MRRFLLYLTCVLVFITLPGCKNPNDAETNSGGSSGPAKTAVLIFPDVTSSIGPTAFDSLQTDLDTLLKSIPYASRVEIIPIGAARDPSTARQLNLPQQTREAIKTRCKDSCTSSRNSVLSWINDQSSVLADIRGEYQESIQIERSCLLNAFERVQGRGLSLLKQEGNTMSGGNFDRIEVILLTDMVEECQETLVGSVDLPRAEGEAREKLDEWLQARDWSILRHPNVRFHFVEQESTARIRASVPNPSTFWRPFLQNFGEEGQKWLLDREIGDIVAMFERQGLPATTPCDQICR